MTSIPARPPGARPLALLCAAGAALLCLLAALSDARLVGAFHFRGGATDEAREEARRTRLLFLGTGLALGLVAFLVDTRLPHGRRGRARTRALLVVLSAGLPLLVADRALRPFVERWTGLFVSDPELGWFHAAGACDTYWGTRVRTNAQGLRGPPTLVPRPAGTRRVLVLGDSVVFGLSLADDEETLPAQLSVELAARVGPVECVNAGVSGWTTGQERAYLRARGLALEPDCVVLVFVLNDPVESIQRYGSDGRGAQLLYARPEGLRGWLAESGLVLALREWSLQRALRRAPEAPFSAYDLMRAPEAPRVEAAWQRTLADLAALQEDCARAGLPLAVVLFPYALQLGLPGSEAPQARLLAFARERSLTCLDLLPAFREAARPAGGDPRAWFLDGVHPSARGNRLAAAEIARFLEAKELLPAVEPR